MRSGGGSWDLGTVVLLCAVCRFLSRAFLADPYEGGNSGKRSVALYVSPLHAGFYAPSPIMPSSAIFRFS